MLKAFTLMATSLVGLGLAALLPARGPDEGPPPPDAKKKGPDAKKEHGPAGDLRKVYKALGRLRRDEGRGGPAEERIRDWTRRAAEFYRKGVKALDDGDGRRAHEYGAMAHDLARAAEHAGNAARSDRRDDDLPPPPGAGPEEDRERTAHHLRHAHDRIREVEDRDPPPEARFYLDAARDLYRAARRDAEAGRLDRAGELACAAEAMSHVPEHLIHLERGPDGPPPPDRKGREKGHRPGPPEDEDDPPPPRD